MSEKPKLNITGSLELMRQVKTFIMPVHVAVICPPGAAVTALLNKMSEHNGLFILMQQIPLETGKLSLSNGQPNVQLFPLLVFSIQQTEFEAWMKVKYDPLGMYQMQAVMESQMKAH